MRDAFFLHPFSCCPSYGSLLAHDRCAVHSLIYSCASSYHCRLTLHRSLRLCGGWNCSVHECFGCTSSLGFALPFCSIRIVLDQLPFCVHIKTCRSIVFQSMRYWLLAMCCWWHRSMREFVRFTLPPSLAPPLCSIRAVLEELPFCIHFRMCRSIVF